MTPSPETNQRLQEGGPQSAPPPRPAARLERNAFFVPLSALGAPRTPGAPTAAVGIRNGRLSPLIAAPPPQPGPWTRFGPGRRLEKARGPKVRRLDRGVGRRGLTARRPPPQPPVALDLALRAPPPNTSPHPLPASPLHTLNPPPGPKSSSPAAQPRAPIIVPPTAPPPDKNLHPLRYRQNPHYSSTSKPPAAVPLDTPIMGPHSAPQAQIQPLQSVATGPHYNAPHSDPSKIQPPPQLRC